MLVTELGVQEGTGDKRAIVRGLVPTNVKMINVYVAQASHHFHLVLDWIKQKVCSKVYTISTIQRESLILNE